MATLSQLKQPDPKVADPSVVPADDEQLVLAELLLPLPPPQAVKSARQRERKSFLNISTPLINLLLQQLRQDSSRLS
jgi:hypothetical protein